MSAKKVTKYDFIEAVYQSDAGYEKKVIQDILDSLLQNIKTSLSDGNTIELRGFGTFEPRLRRGREKARNPKTGEALSVTPHHVAVFRAGRELKNALWELPVEEDSASSK